MNSEKILIIDDSEEVVKFLTSDVLPHQGYQPIWAHDGQRGLEMIRKEQPDLILLDYHLPNMTGFDILQQMIQESISIPTIVMTGYGSELSAMTAFRLGAKDYIIKPFTIAEIINAIDRALTERRLQNDNAELLEEIRRLKAEMNRQAREMQTMFEIGKSIASFLTVDQVLEQVLRAAKALTQADRSDIWLPDETITYLDVFQLARKPQRQQKEWRVAIEGSTLGRVFRAERPFRHTKYTADKIELAPAHRVQAVMAVPLRLAKQTLGILTVSSQEEMITFSQREEFLLSFLADYAAIALENARIFQATDSALAARVQELDTLLHIAQTINSSLDLQTVVQQTIRYVHQGWNIEASSLWWRNENEMLSVLANVGTQTDVLDQIELSVGQGIVGQVVQTGDYIYTNHVKQHPAHLAQVDQQTKFHTKSLLCVPLFFQGRVIGAMQLLNKRNGRFDEQDIERATSFAAIVGIAIMNAKLFRQMEQLPVE